MILTSDKLRQLRAQYSDVRDAAIAQANAATGKIDLLDELLRELATPEAADAGNQPVQSPAESFAQQ